MKKTLSLLLALIMVLSLATTAFATSVTISGGAGRKFEAYQILTASVDEEKEAYTYSVNMKYLDILASVAGVTNAAGTDDDADVADDIMTYIRANLKKAADVQVFANKVYRQIQDAAVASDKTIDATSETVDPAADLDQGYWLIADVTDFSAEEDLSNSLVMVDTVGKSDLPIIIKPDTPSIVKKIDDENDSISGEDALGQDATNLQDSADYDIGDSVPYSITLEMPNNLSSYEFYSIILRDTLSPGLEFEPESFAITVNGKTCTIGEVGGTTDFVYEIKEGTRNIYTDETSEVDILYVYPNYDYINVETHETVARSYTNGGDLLQIKDNNGNSIATNDCKIVFTYTCELTSAAKIGEPGNPNWADLFFYNNPYGHSFGKTEEDVCIVFTYKFVVNKVDSQRRPLDGATFHLWKFVEQDSTVEGGETHNNTYGIWVKVGDMKTEKVEDDPETQEDETQYLHYLTGLDDGHYKLTETPPAGYTAIEDIHFDITATHHTEFDVYTETGLLTALNGEQACETFINLTATAENGNVGFDQLNTTIENTTGTKLPETGGMGTTIFYTLGAIMVLGAAILLVTKKRMSAEA